LSLLLHNDIWRRAGKKLFDALGRDSRCDHQLQKAAAIFVELERASLQFAASKAESETGQERVPHSEDIAAQTDLPLVRARRATLGG